MNNPELEGPTIDAGLCRFCGLLKKCRVLNAGYQYKGYTEVYSDMIFNCFGIAVSTLLVQIFFSLYTIPLFSWLSSYGLWSHLFLRGVGRA